MINLKYSLVIEATDDPTFFGFYSPELEGFTGIGHSIEDCPYQARWGMEEHLATLKDKGLPIPDPKLESYRRHPKRTASWSSGLTAAMKKIAR